jgi:hypothetical protein
MASRVKVKVKDSDPGFRKLRKRFKGPDSVDVGVFGEQGSDLVIYTASNEFGTDKIPERSFLRAGTDEAKGEFKRFLRKGTLEVLRGRSTKTKLIGRLGLLGQKKVVEKINTGSFTPNAPSTMRAKARGGKGTAFSEIVTKKTSLGVNRPLIDTGRMRASITTRLQGKVRMRGQQFGSKAK